MTLVQRLCLALAMVFTAAAPALAAPLEAYGKLPNIETGAISPSGRSVAVISTNGESRRVVVMDLAANKITLLADAGAAKIRDLRWAGESHLILTTTVTAVPFDVIARRSEYAMAFDLDLESRKLRRLLNTGEQMMNIIADTPQVRTVAGQPMVLLQGVYFAGVQGQQALFRIKPPSISAARIEDGRMQTREWAVGPDGTAVGQLLYDTENGRWVLMVKPAGGTWRPAQALQTLADAPAMLGLGRDGKSVLISGRSGWREVSTETGAWGEAIPTVDDQAPIHDTADGRLIGHHALVGDADRYTFFNPEDARVWASIVKSFRNDRVEFVSWSDDRRQVLVLVDSPTEGPAFAHVDMNAKRSNWLGDQFQDIEPEDIGPVRPVRYKAADGLDLTGYLTLPRGRDPRNLPLVVFPHGGPAARDKPGFDWWAQAMASRGYAVLQVNFRGSDGFGGAFQAAGFGQWGRKMQTDLSDGVRNLAAQGIIDPTRVCIVGASYGGYAALAGATLDRGVYRCAASFGGVFDLRRHIAYSRDGGGNNVALRYWTRFMGAENIDDPVLAQYSPNLQADKADIPVLLIHGRDDTVVLAQQSQLMADALRKAGKPVELVMQKGADHWLSLGETRLAMLQAVVAFLEKNNPPS